MTIREISGKKIPLKMRRAIPDQAETLTQIAFAAKRHWGYPERRIQIWSPILTVSANFIEKHETYVAQKEGERVGFYAISVVEDKASLEHMWVLPEYMGQGIGAMLFNHALSRCKEFGVQVLEIESDPNAQGFYERMGAKIVGEHVGDVKGQPRILPVLEISLDH